MEEPWQVKAVRMDAGKQTVEVDVAVKAGHQWRETEAVLRVHGYESRRWRHLDTCQFSTVILAQVPRLLYPDGHTALAPVPWADARSRPLDALV